MKISYLCNMKDTKTLYEILTKYDGDKSFSSFCDSISNIIQNKFNDNDIINIIAFSNIIDSQDDTIINDIVGIRETAILF